jgi:hypothetical protein
VPRPAYILTVAMLLALGNPACAADPNQALHGAKDPNSIIAPVSPELDSMLSRLSSNLAKLQSCRLDLTWTFTQPLLETATVRSGTLYYKRGDGSTAKSGRSHLRISFNSFQQDKEKPQALHEEILFDGIWLTRIDYQLKEVKRDQLAQDDKPLDAFQLLTGRMPLVGFGSIDDLKKQFVIEMKILGSAEARTVQLVLTPRPDSEYIRDYKQVDIFTKATDALPERIKALTADDDVSEIVLKRSVSQDVPDSVFEVPIPGDFTTVSKTLKNNGN